MSMKYLQISFVQVWTIFKCTLTIRTYQFCWKMNTEDLRFFLDIINKTPNLSTTTFACAVLTKWGHCSQ